MERINQDQWSGVVNTEYGEKFTDFSTERGFGRGGKLADVKQRRGNTNDQN